MKVGLIQQKNTAGRVMNMGKLKVNTRKAAQGGAELIVLRELHNSLYFYQTEDTNMFSLTGMIPGPSTETFSASAKELGIILVSSLFEKRAPDLHHNTAVVLEKSGTIAGKYRKMHVSDDPVYYEKFYSTPDDLGSESIDASVRRPDVLVCWDQWYSETARLMAMRGAEMLVYPTVIGQESSDTQEEKDCQLGVWVTIQRGHAVTNGFPVIPASHAGYKPDPSGQTGGIWFWGNSPATGPQGELLIVFPNDEEEMRVIEIGRTRGESVCRRWSLFRGHCIDAFDGLTERFLVQ